MVHNEKSRLMQTTDDKLIVCTYWTKINVELPDPLTITQERFFQLKKSGFTEVHEMVLPDSLPFDKLINLIGKKTRITIEVIE